MQQKTSAKGKTVWIVSSAVAGTILIGVLGLLILVYTGAYNVSAAVGHTAIGRWALETMMRNSVQARADAEAPDRFTPAMIRAGAGEYKAMCQHCHGGPGERRAEWANGMVPRPPDLAHAAIEWEPAEVHWIVKNGIKMTAMPAFGSTHDDRTIWNIAAFVKQMPAITPGQYASIPESHGENRSSEPSGEHTH